MRGSVIKHDYEALSFGMDISQAILQLLSERLVVNKGRGRRSDDLAADSASRQGPMPLCISQGLLHGHRGH